MRRENLEKIPEFPLPKNISVRRFQPSDEKIWREIQSLADPEQRFTDSSFAKIFGGDASILRERQFFLLGENQKPVGTVTAWIDDYFSDPKQGRVHWLAVIPEQQGRGLGKILLSICLRRLRELEYRSAYLKTWPTRLAAINLYLQFGFVPWLSGVEELQLWEQLPPNLKTNLSLNTDELLRHLRPRTL